MQSRAFLSATLFATFLTATCVAQGPVGDEVVVTFDRPVLVGSETLPPGKYTIRQVTSASNPRVLEFTSDNGTKLDATVTAIPILQNTPPSESKVILDDERGSVRLSKIWVQGKSYGYEFPGTAGSAGASTAGVNLEGRFEAQAPPPAPSVVAQTPPPPAPAHTPAPAQPANPEVAQNQPEPAPQAPAAAPEPAPAPENPAATAPGVPVTALGWIPIASLGLLMAASGLMLYWREKKIGQ